MRNAAVKCDMALVDLNSHYCHDKKCSTFNLDDASRDIFV